MGPIVSLQDISLRYHSISGETPAVSHLELVKISLIFVNTNGSWSSNAFVRNS